ncbi:MAG: alpha-galactosidase [Victivallaceae bacterium]|nr:alpha-galactosidase [Victivallaceae bacterium]
MKFIRIQKENLHLLFAQDPAGPIRLLHCAAFPCAEDALPTDEEKLRRFELSMIHLAGKDRWEPHGNKHSACDPGGTLCCTSLEEQEDSLVIVERNEWIEVVTRWQFFHGIRAFRATKKIRNLSEQAIPLEYAATFALTGAAKESPAWDAPDVRISFARSGWKTEHRWESHTLPELGLSHFHAGEFCINSIALNNTGTFACKEYLPMGVLETASGTTAWEIQTTGSWHWELGDVASLLYMQLSGPTFLDNFWCKHLAPGETFETVPVLLAFATGRRDDALRELTRLRRAIRRPNEDNLQNPILFNDYMNCLFAKATEEKLLPLIDRAASLGAEIFVTDAGWYASRDEDWWPTVGLWQESPDRFPHGLRFITDYIRSKGMRAGLWLEIERMGTLCPLVHQWPEECFFRRNGAPIIENRSLQLDFRHPLVREYATETVERLIRDYQIGFFKFDYNIDPGPGTEVGCATLGDGLLEHKRCYKAWLAKVFERHPDLVIENCSSGGNRATSGLLDLHSLCSTTDNECYRSNAKISIASAAAYPMEQAGVWMYPLASADDEEVIMNMVSAMSWRIFLSGEVMALSEEKLELIREGCRFYREHIAPKLSEALPRWPLGLGRPESEEGAFLLDFGPDCAGVLSVWNFTDQPRVVTVPVAAKSCTQVYPEKRPVPVELGQNSVAVTLPGRSARIFQLEN